MRKPTTLGITLGDAGGIGPETAIKAAAAVDWPESLKLVLVGSRDIIRRECRRQKIKLPPIWNPDSGKPTAPVQTWEPPKTPRITPTLGVASAPASRAAVHGIRATVKLCMQHKLDGIVTAPICKEGLMRAKIDYPGHTEMLADWSGNRDVEMMLIGGALRVTLATRHVPISSVESLLTTEGIQRAVTFTAQALEWLGAAPARIAVCGLNPHAGDGGAIGRAEIDLIAPALKKLPDLGVEIVGPVSADTVFHYARKREYGAVVAMYHDQGLAPLKMLAFDKGVNLTLGLPFVRTSPDHGTAFNIAGKNIASATSMVAAIRTASRLCRRKNPWADNGR